jgi:hypothetical protein
MRAEELIGKTVLRILPIDLLNGNKDYSYCNDTPIKIISYNGHHIEIASGVGCGSYFLDPRWDDNNWIEVVPTKVTELSEQQSVVTF